MPKRLLPLAADVALNQLQTKAALERYQGLSEVDDDAPHRPDAAAEAEVIAAFTDAGLP